MKVLVTGADGQLGHDTCQILERLDVEYIAANRQVVDLCDDEQIKKVVYAAKAQCIIHCAAYTDVNAAEDNELLCMQINAHATGIIADVCRELKSTMVYISTDYVFDGCKQGIYTISDIPHPINVYGSSKLAGEQAVRELVTKHFILRTSWLYGGVGKNFVNTILALARNQTEIEVVADQIGSPTFTRDLAEFICKLLNSSRYGTYHVTNQGYCSWAEFAEEILRQSKNTDCKVRYTNSSDYSSRAHRPQNSRLDGQELSKSGFCLLPEWQHALQSYLQIKNE